MKRFRSDNTPMYVFMAILLVAIGISFYASHSETSSVSSRVAKIESPCLKYTEDHTAHNKLLCEESFEKAIATITHPEACAVERKAGTLKAIRELGDSLGVDFKEPCAGARLRQERTRGHERSRISKRGTSNTPTNKPGPLTSVPVTSSPGGSTQHPHPAHPEGDGHGGGGSPHPPSGSGGPPTGGDSPPPSPPGPPGPEGPPGPPSTPPEPPNGVHVGAPELPVKVCVPPLIGVNC